MGAPRALSLVLLLALTQSVVAQQPQENVYALNLTPGAAPSHVPILGQVRIPIRVEDASLVQPASLQPTLYQVRVDVSIVSELPNPGGWQASPIVPFRNSFPGDVWDTGVLVQLNPPVFDTDVIVRVNATILNAPGDQQPSFVLDLLVRAAPFPNLDLFLGQAPPRLGPGESAMVRLRVVNNNYYPDIVQIRARSTAILDVASPPPVMLQPYEETVVYLAVRAPSTPVFTFGYSETVSLVAESQLYPGVRQPGGVPVVVQGGYLPAWMATHLLMTLFAAAILVRNRAEDRRDRRSEAGRPERPPGGPVALLRGDVQGRRRYGALLLAWRSQHHQRRLVERRLNRVTRQRADMLEDEERRRREAAEQARKAKEAEVVLARQALEEEGRAQGEAAARESRRSTKEEKKRIKDLEAALKQRRRQLERMGKGRE